jgi:serine phosphatase RsbU (regulator of sigma subunit)
LPSALSGTQLLDRSRAFREAALRSERHRSYAVLVAVLIVLGPLFLFVGTTPIEPNLLIVGSVAGLVLVAIQAAVIITAGRERALERGMPVWLSAAAVAAECSLPTGALLAHIELGTKAPFVVLTTPPLMAYALIIALNPLRLRPWLCILGGAVAALGYISLLLMLRTRGLRPPEDGWPAVGYLMAPLLILVSGIASAWVSREIRTYLEAALREADLQRRMERIDHDLLIASTIQRALLPRSAPTVAGFQIAGWNRPADQTGGDYYDWQQLPDGRWIITLADVSGHGIGPALVTASCRAYVRAASHHAGDLASLATRVNLMLAEDLLAGRFVTMVNVLIDPSDGSMAMLSAGHGPIMLLVAETGEIRDFMPQNIPLAISPDEAFAPAAAIALTPGDSLVLVTDGVIEWARPGDNGPAEQFGAPRLRAALTANARLKPDALIDAVVAEIERFAGPETQQDDVTMVVIRRE